MSLEFVTLIATVSSIGFITITTKPLFGLFSIVIIRLLLENPPINLNINYTYINYLLGISFYIIFVYLMATKKDFNIANVPARLFLIFVFFSSLSILNISSIGSNFIEYAIFLSKLLVMPLIFYIFFNIINDRYSALRAINYFVYISIPLVTLGYIQLVSGSADHFSNYWGQQYSRVFSTFSHSNQFAFYLALILFSILLLFYFDNRRKFLFIYFCIVCVQIVLTYSRSVWFTSGACLFIFSLFNSNFRKPFIIIILFAFIFLAPTIQNGLKDIINPDPNQYSSLDMRFDITRDLARYTFINEPVFGFGLGSSSRMVHKITGRNLPPHNDYLRVFVESGCVGLLFFSIFILSLFIPVYRNINNIKSNIPLQIYFLLITFFSVIITATNHLGNVSTLGMWFALLGLISKILIIENKQHENNTI